MIEKLSLDLSEWIYLNTPQESSKLYICFNDFKNRVKIVLMHIFLAILLISTGMITGTLAEMVSSTLSIFFLRVWNGGHHFKSADLCLVVTYSVIIAVLALSIVFKEIVLYLALFSLPVIILCAPYKKNKNTYNFKKITMIILCVLSALYFPVMSIAIFVQSFDLIKYSE